MNLPKFDLTGVVPDLIDMESLMTLVNEAEEKYSTYSEFQKYLVKRASPLQVNPCGGCTVCCEAPSIDESKIDGKVLESPKPACVKCPNLLESGCSQYTQRPEVCSGFLCLYAMGVLDNDPRIDGGAWTVKNTEDGLVAICHAKDVDVIFRSAATAPIIRGFINSESIVGVVVMDDKKAISVDCSSGQALMVDIDQSKFLKNQYKDGTVRVLGIGIPVLQ